MSKDKPLVFWTAAGVLLIMFSGLCTGAWYIIGLGFASTSQQRVIDDHEKRIVVAESVKIDVAVMKAQLQSIEDKIDQISHQTVRTSRAEKYDQ